jgi:hypothetical protein
MPGTIVLRMVVCGFCGQSSTPPTSADGSGPADDDVPLTWVTSVENGRVRVYCDECARGNLRSIESKLDSEWW